MLARIVVLAVFAGWMTVAAAAEPPVQTMFFRAATTGGQWDTWLYWHEGSHYLFLLAGPGGQWHGLAMATSPDGVHWKEQGVVLRRAEGVTWLGTGATWRSPQFEHDAKYQLNFSEWRGPRQTIFFAESSDLVHWSRLGAEYEFVQDERWYEPAGRWDCIYPIARPEGGLFGYWTATPKAATGGRFGFGQSRDGVRWEALPPPRVEGVGEGEVGAVEKIGPHYYMMFGTGGKMVTLVADRPEGPFRAAVKNPVLLSGYTYFSRFYPTPDGLLVNHHSIAGEQDVRFAPLKLAEVDVEGTLRLKWWKGNERLKARPVEVQPSAAARSAPTMLLPTLDARGGLVLEASVAMPSLEGDASGLYIDSGEDSGVAIRVGPGGVTELGPMQADGTGWKAENRIDRQAAFGPTARCRLLLQERLLEFYLDDHLIQCWRLPGDASGRIGLLGEVKDVRVWQVE